MCLVRLGLVIEPPVAFLQQGAADAGVDAPAGVVVDRRRLAGQPHERQHDEPIVRVLVQQVARVVILARLAVLLVEPTGIGAQSFHEGRDLANDHWHRRSAIEEAADVVHELLKAVESVGECGHRRRGREDTGRSAGL